MHLSSPLRINVHFVFDFRDRVRYVLDVVTKHIWDLDVFSAVHDVWWVLSVTASLAWSTLRTWARRIGTPVFAVGNAKVGILRLVLDAINGLNGIGDVCEVNKCTVPATNISPWAIITWVKVNLLLLQEVDQFDISELAKVPLESLFTESLEVLNVTNVHVPCCSRMHSKRQCGR